MKKFNTGEPYTLAKTKSRIETWSNRWKNQDPFNFYAIFDKNLENFMGIIGIGHSTPGASEVCYVLHHKFWNKGFCSEAVTAFIHTLIPRLMLRGYKLLHKSLKLITATARLDNPASQKILKKVGFTQQIIVSRFAAERFLYELPAKKVKNFYHHFFQKRDKAVMQNSYFQAINSGVDISTDEMLQSSFGNQSNTAKRLCMFNNFKRPITKSEFNCIQLLSGPLKNKSITEQDAVLSSYKNDEGQEISVDLCHGIIVIFYIKELGNFVLGVSGINTDINAYNAVQLQASIGDNAPLQYCKKTIFQTLNILIESETNKIFSLSKFKLSPFYVSHRNAAWNLCYLKMMAISTECFSMDEFKEKIISINKYRVAKNQATFGIYKLDDVVKSANTTASLEENNKIPANLLNYLLGIHEPNIILDDIAINTFFNNFDGENLDKIFEPIQNSELYTHSI